MAAAAPLAVTAPLDELVARALARVPILEAAQANASAQRLRADAAGSPYWPQVAAQGAYSRSSGVPQGALGNLPANGGLLNLTVRQVLWNFGLTDAQVEAARANAAGLDAQARASAADVGFRVREAYLTWAQARALEARVQQQLRNAEQLAAQAGSFVRHGARPRIELTRAEVAVARAKADRVDASNGVAIARRTLETAMGGEPVEGEPAFPPDPRVARLTLPEIARRAAGHPALAAGEAAVRAAEAVAQVAERQANPELSGNGGYGLRYQDPGGATPAWQAGLNLAWPLFTGFQVTNQRQAAGEAARAARALLRDRGLEIQLAAERAQLQLTGARERLVALRSARHSADENRRLAENRYRNGVGAIIEVSEAQALLAAAEADVVRGEGAYHLAAAALVRALGATGLEPELLEGQRP